jgi:pyridoxal phosphate enzyme (YggS family)
MSVNQQAYIHLQNELSEKDITLIAVSKTKPVADILELYHLGHRDFGENYVQELTDKATHLPDDIRWHFIGHLQRNKVKYILPFVHLIHSIDSLKLLLEIEKQAAKIDRKVSVLLQIYIAGEETKFGLNEEELNELIDCIQKNPLQHVQIKGMMGMASFTKDNVIVEKEFIFLRTLFEKYKTITIQGVAFDTLSMGMSSDYSIAIQHGSNMVRVGSLLFGERNYAE